jgi:hypothetical protein
VRRGTKLIHKGLATGKQGIVRGPVLRKRAEAAKLTTSGMRLRVLRQVLAAFDKMTPKAFRLWVTEEIAREERKRS